MAAIKKVKSKSNVPSIELRNVTKSYDGVPILKNVNLTIDPLNITTIIGRSGAGKSTLFRIIAGLEKCDSGDVFINGKQVDGEGIFVEPGDRDVSIVFQDYALFPHMSILKNVMYAVKGKDKKTKEKISAEILTKFELEKHLHKKPHQLSGGQQQRVAVARAIASRSNIILFDEAFSGYDALLAKDVKRYITEVIRDYNITPIFITHDQEEAFSHSDKIALMYDGEILQHDTPFRIFHYPECARVALFVYESSIHKAKVNDSGQIVIENCKKKLQLPVPNEINKDLFYIGFRADSFEIFSPSAMEGTLKEVIFLGYYYEYIIDFHGITLHIHSTKKIDKKEGTKVSFIAKLNKIIYVNKY